MSCWFPRSHRSLVIDYRTRALWVLIFLVGAGTSARADEYYVQPRADVGVEVDSNRDMVSSGPKTTAEGYSAEAGATIGIATPVSDTTLRPQVNYYDYPILSENVLDSRLDFASSFDLPRTHFGIYGVFDHQALFGSELASATFNLVNPNLPTTPETGRISVSGTRTLLTVNPKYEFEWTERLGLQISGVYQDLGYSGASSAGYISYVYYDVTADLDWKLSPRSDISLGLDGSKESAKDIESVSDGHGITLTFNHQWSTIFSGSLSLVAEQYDIYGVTPAGAVIPISSRVNSSGVGAQYTSTWTGQISQFQVTVGRTFTPNGAGGTFASDQFQVEYKRNLSPRTYLDVAAHYIQNVAISSLYDEGNYNYVIAAADLKWMLTRTWYVAGGLQYVELKFPVPGTAANNSMAHVRFGYEGLGRQY